MGQLKLGFTTILGLLCTAIGVRLRLAARDLAWTVEWSYSGPRDDTVWAIREHGYPWIWLVSLTPCTGHLDLGAAEPPE